MKNLTTSEKTYLQEGVRWCTNILVEISSNLAKKLSPERRESFHLAITHLKEVVGHKPEGDQ